MQVSSNQIVNTFGTRVKLFSQVAYDTIIHWKWTKTFLYWLVLSAGTVSECCFLLASLWMSINSSVHNFVRIFLSEDTTVHISELATTAYVALPECILGLSLVITIGHARLFWYDTSKNKLSLMWAILYGLPTLVFLSMTTFTIGASVLSIHFTMPDPLIVIRALAGYMFGLIAFLYSQLGVPQEVDRLKKRDQLLVELQQDNQLNMTTKLAEKDDYIARLRQQNEHTTQSLQKQLTTLQQTLSNEREYHNQELANLKAQYEQVHNARLKSDETALDAYSEECKSWLLSGSNKTVTIDDIVAYTGHSKRRISEALKSGKLKTSSRNADLILVSYLVSWLNENTPNGNHKAQRTTDKLVAQTLPDNQLSE